MQVEQKINDTYYQPYTFTDTTTRIFNCNAISFTNQGTGDVYINDVYLLPAGESVSLNSNQNEVDKTIYKMSFASGFVNRLAVMVKINQGSTSNIQNALSKLVPPMSRRDQIKAYVKRRNRGDF